MGKQRKVLKRCQRKKIELKKKTEKGDRIDEKNKENKYMEEIIELQSEVVAPKTDKNCFSFCYLN